MKKSVLITGGNTFLGQQLVEQYIRQDWSVATAVAANTEAGEQKQELKESLLIIPWNRNSIFSAKTVVREASRSFGQIDEFIILHQPPVINTAFEETAITELDDVVDECINGTVYLTREILDYCADKNDILLSYALQGDLGESGPAMTDGSAGFFRYFARGIIGRKRHGLYQTAYYSPKQDHKGFAEFIFQYNQGRKEKGNGEWLRYSEKKPLFSQVPVIKKEF
jgi:NAD(P)-dependent dehydrogenase (short-subunit alcohol dehydrogenase family)